MGITHVMRGEDGISNTPRQILIQEALGAPRPLYAHIPLILAADKSKLSGRHGAVSVREYRDKGYLPGAIINYLALLGWNPGTEQEIFTLDELVKVFDLSKVQKGGAIFNEEKLRWINKEHLKKTPIAEFAAEAKKRIEATSRALDLKWSVTEQTVAKIVPALVDRINTYGDITKLVESLDLDYYFMEPTYDALSLKWKQDVDLAPAKKHLEHIKATLTALSDKKWAEEDIKALLWPYAEANGRGNVLWPFRFALSGKDKSPNPFTLAAIVGKDATLRRIDYALNLCAHVQ
jgi:glutamyl/glutaminyl-tRNA synthetase